MTSLLQTTSPKTGIMAMTINELLKTGMAQLEEAKVPDASIDAQRLLEATFEIDMGYRLMHGDDELSEIVTESDEKISEYRNLINQRSLRIPLQHILGYQDFMGMRFLVTPDVLIPRQDTEILVEEALKEIHDGMRILDMCTGSGCILISLLKYSNDCSGAGIDISDKALNIAKRNAEGLLMDKQNVSCEFLQSDLFDSFEDDEKFDIIVSNPPYINSDVIATLEPEVRNYDPLIALDGGDDGLYFYQKIIMNADKYLKGGGRILFEIGYDQSKSVTDLLEKYGYTDIETIKDYAGLDRVVKAGRKICLTN